jgi:Fe-S-cluster-containing hydrogenase component 2
VLPMIEHSYKTIAVFVPFVQTGLCQHCEPCAARQNCRTKALVRLDREESPWVDAGRCYGCGNCIPSCPHGAIALPKRAEG